MGAEQLEEDEVEPMFAGLEGSLGGKKIALFGSYGWGDGQWMREWCSRCAAAGASLYDEEGLTANESPSEEAREACRELGRKLAGLVNSAHQRSFFDTYLLFSPSTWPSRGVPAARGPTPFSALPRCFQIFPERGLDRYG